MAGGERERRTQQAMPAVSVTSAPRFRLVHATGSLLLVQGVVLIGRDPDCHVQVDDPLASRHHARVATDHRGTIVADLASINGTWVNGASINGPHVVAAGDKLLVGGQELQFVDAHASGTRVAAPVAAAAPATSDSVPPTFPRPSNEPGLRSSFDARRGSYTPPGGSPRTIPPATPRIRAASDMDRHDVGLTAGPARAHVETTGRVNAFELLGALADKAFALEQNERAAELVAPYLRNILAAARSGSAVSAETSQFVARYAVKLGAVTGDPAWVDLALELFTLLKMPLPSSVVDELAAPHLRVPLNRPLLRRYVDVLRASVVQFSAVERGLVQRIARLDPSPSVERR